MDITFILALYGAAMSTIALWCLWGILGRYY